MKEGASTEQSAVVPQSNHSTGTDHLPTQQWVLMKAFKTVQTSQPQGLPTYIISNYVLEQ